MGGFCVYGNSRGHCRKQAEKLIPGFVFEGVAPGVKRALSAVEWGTLVAAAAEKLFTEAVRDVRISPEFDAPQFCRDWIAAAPDQVKNTKIMYRGPKIDKHGGAVTRDGVPVMTWLPFDESVAWPRPFGESTNGPAFQSV